MIPFIRSFTELMVITESRERLNTNTLGKKLKDISEENSKKNIRINSKNKDLIGLPDLPKIKRQKWKKSKEAVSKFFDELDYNNQIQSSYDLTLLESQNSYNKHDAA